MKKVIWKLSVDEKDEILDLFERKVALENLSKIIEPDNEKLYNRFISDYGKTVTEFQNWWRKTSEKYDWEGKDWSIDFDTNEVLMK